MSVINLPASDPLKKPFTVINDRDERRRFADLLHLDLTAIKKIGQCAILEKYFYDFKRDLNCSYQEHYWPKIYTQEPNPDFLSLINKLTEEIKLIATHQEKLIREGVGIDANRLISPKGFKSAEHLLNYWTNIKNILEAF